MGACSLSLFTDTTAYSSHTDTMHAISTLSHYRPYASYWRYWRSCAGWR